MFFCERFLSILFLRSTPFELLETFISMEKFESNEAMFECVADIREELATGERDLGEIVYVYYDGCDRDTWPRGLYRLYVGSK